MLILYTTAGCHLCERAERVLAPLLARHELSLERVDIALSDALTTRYGVRIPVLKWTDSESELCWPFDEAAAALFLQRGLA